MWHGRELAKFKMLLIYQKLVFFIIKLPHAHFQLIKNMNEKY